MDQQLKQLTLEILEGTYLMSLATLDEEGIWVADVTFTYDDELNLYWMSKSWRRHSEAIKLNPKVAGAITFTTSPLMRDAGLQLSGVAEQVDEIPWSSVEHYFKKRQKPQPKPTDDILGEHLWYRLIPDRIELIYNEQFGQDRQKVR